MNSLASPGFKLSPDKPSVVGSKNVLNDEDTFRAISTYRQVFQSCIGPRGRCKLVHNGVGGHVTVTSCCGRLLKASNIKNPVLRLITTGVQSHLDLFTDGGCLTAMLASLLIERSLQLEINRRLVCDVLDALTVECLRYLNSNDCPARVTVSLDGLCDLVSVVNGITSTKPASGLASAELDHINRCLIEAFLKTTPDSTETKSASCGLQYLCLAGKRSTHSYVTNGILVSCDQIPANRVVSLKPRRITKGANRDLIATVIYGTSLAGDAEDSQNIEYELSPELYFDDAVLKCILGTAENLVAQNVGLVMCQKVIHPEAKRFLTDQGVLVFDRLGLVKIRQLCNVVGGRLLSSFQSSAVASDFGYAANVAHEIIDGKSYIRLEGAREKMFTLVLFGLTEESLDELKHVCIAANHVLWQIIEKRFVLKGGGIWQKDLAQHLQRLSSQVHRLGETFRCFEFETESVIKTVSDCFMQVYATINGKSSCDECTEDDGNGSDSTGYETVLDSFGMAVNAVKSALFLAQLVLGIKHSVIDLN